MIFCSCPVTTLHDPHEWVRGARRTDCPGVTTTTAERSSPDSDFESLRVRVGVLEGALRDARACLTDKALRTDEDSALTEARRILTAALPPLCYRAPFGGAPSCDLPDGHGGPHSWAGSGKPIAPLLDEIERLRLGGEAGKEKP